jgi:rRNA small subunit pseudouridine methyltransferase Nep1
MVRPYAVKWRKKQDKKRKLEETLALTHGEEEEEELEDKERKVEEEDVEEEEEEQDEAAAADDVAGLPVVARPIDGSKKKKGVIFVLERACLEVGKVGKVSRVIVFSIISFWNWNVLFYCTCLGYLLISFCITFMSLDFSNPELG